MKIITFCIVTILLLGFTFKNKTSPPGTVKFKENLYIDQTEISNQHWVDYMNWTKKEYGVSSEEYLSSLLDTTVWLDSSVNKFNKPFATHYLKHKAYRDYPVVGVSYEQAVNYCKWRAARVNEFIFIRSQKKGVDIKKEKYNVPNYVKYRLPTKQEWEEVAVLPLSKKGKRKTKNKNIAACNLKRVENIDIKSNHTKTVTTPVCAYFPNELNVFCIKGNVAEIIQEKGITKGGHWNMREDDFDVEKDYAFTKPNSYTGFRCVAEVLIAY